MTARFSRSLAVIVGLFVFAGGCAGGGNPEPPTGPTPPSADVTAAAGAYSLVSIDGATLPTVTVTRPCIGFTDSGMFTLTTPSSYTFGLKAHFICDNGPGPMVTTDDSGTWTASGANITFSGTPRPGGPLLNLSMAVLSGNTLTLSFDAPSYGEGIAARRVTSVWRK